MISYPDGSRGASQRIGRKNRVNSIALAVALAVVVAMLQAAPAHAAAGVTITSLTASRVAYGTVSISGTIGVAGHRAPGEVCAALSASACSVGYQGRRAADGVAVDLGSASGAGTTDPFSLSKAVSNVNAPRLDAVRAYVSGSWREFGEWITFSDTYPLSTTIQATSVSTNRNSSGELLVSVTAAFSGYRMPGGTCGGVNQSTGCLVGYEVRRQSDGVWIRQGTRLTNSSNDPDTVTWATQSLSVPTVDGIRTFIESANGTLNSAVIPVSDPYPSASSVSISSVSGVRSTSGSYKLTATVGGQGLRMPGGVCQGAWGNASASNCFVGLEVRMADGSVRQYTESAWTSGAGDPFVFTGMGGTKFWLQMDAVRAYIRGTNGTIYTDWQSIVDSYPANQTISLTEVVGSRTTGQVPYYSLSSRISGAGFRAMGRVCDGTCTADCYFGREFALSDGTTKRFESKWTSTVGDSFSSFSTSNYSLGIVTAVRAYIRGAGGEIDTEWQELVDNYPAVATISLEVTQVTSSETSGKGSVSYTVSASGTNAPGRLCASPDNCRVWIYGSHNSINYHSPLGAVTRTLIPDPLSFGDAVGGIPNTELGSFYAELCNISTNECIRSAVVGGHALAAGENVGGGNPASNGCACFEADPINTSTGEFYLPVPDIALPGVGPMVGVTRTYSAMSAAQNGPFGYGWAASFGAKVVVVTPGAAGAPPLVVDVVQENGSRTRFTQQSDGSYLAAQWMRATLQRDAATGSWDYVRNKGENLRFDGAGRLTQMRDRFSNAVTYGYDAAGNLVSITGSGGRQVTLSWASGRVGSVSDSAGRTTSFTYNGSGNLVSVEAVDGAVWAYGYDTSHRMTTLTKPGGGVTTNVFDPSGRTTSQTDPTGRVTGFAYSYNVTTITYPDGTKRAERYVSGLPVEIVEAVGTATEMSTWLTYDPKSNLIRTRDSAGRTTTATYDASGNEISSRDALGRITSRTFDSAGNVLTVSDPLGRVTAFTYNSFDQMISTTSPGGRTQTWAYNADGTVASITSPGGQTVELTYTPRGQISCQGDGQGHENCITYNLAGQAIGTVDAAGNTTTTTYDLAGRPLTRTDANGLTTSVAYDDDGNVVESTSPLGHVSSASYDAAGRLTTATDAEEQDTTYSYSPTGQVSTVTDAAGVTTYEYDALERLVRVTDAEGRVSSRTYDLVGNTLTQVSPSGMVTSFAYDFAGQIVKQTDPLGKVTRFTYDAAGQLISVKDPLNRTTTTTYSLDGEVLEVEAPDGASESYAYDANGNLTQYTNPDGAVTAYAYNGAGQLVSKTEPGGRITGYAYDVLGQVTTRAGPDGGSTTYGYDDGSRLVSIDRPGTDADTAFAYNDDGQRSQMVDATGTTNYTYTTLGQLASVTDGDGVTIGYEYDSRGRMTTLIYPGGDEVDYAYDDTGLMTSVTDWLGNKSDFEWTADGQLESQSLANGVTGEYGYDAAGRSTSIDYAKGASPLASYGYSYDAAGQLTGSTLDDPLNASTEAEFGYDLRGQIATVAGSGGYTISPAGLVTATPEGATLDYNAKLELTSMADAAASTAFTFDANGSRASQVRTPATGLATTTSFSYNAAGSLASVALPGGSGVSYTSDGDGLRQTRTVGASTDEFVWNVNAGLPLLLDDGEHRYVYGPTSTPIAQYDASDEVEYLLADLLGSVRVVTDAVGAIVGSASFGVYGAVEATSGVVSAFGFTGAWTDESTGLVYLRARDYDPTTGQFLQVDPAVDDTRQPYAYAYNNPLMWTDPTGLDVWGDIGNGVLGFAAGALDSLTFGLSSMVLGAVIPDYDCWTQSNPWFATGQVVATVVSIALLAVTGVGLAFAAGKLAITAAKLAIPAAKVVAEVGLKAAAKMVAATIKSATRTAIQSVKAAASSARRALADDRGSVDFFSGAGRGGQKLSPDPNAGGAPHTTFRRAQDNSITHYAEWTPNPRSPRGYDIVKRYDGVGGEHFDKVTRTYIPTPHVQGPGWVRPPQIWEIPR